MNHELTILHGDESETNPKKSRMTQELKEELSRIGLQGEFFILTLKEGANSIRTFAPSVILLPNTLLPQFTSKMVLNAELLASGLKISIDKLRPHGPTALLAESLLSLSRALGS